MIYFFDHSGRSTRCIPEHIRQGSADANTITVVAPVAENAQLSVAFCLPTGESTQKYYMQFIGPVEGILTAQEGTLYGWRTNIPALVTSRYGQVIAQFYCSYGQGITALRDVMFTVDQGVAGELPDGSENDSYDKILAVISQIMSELHNSAYAARALFGFSSAFAYSLREIVYCPDAYEHGSFVRSLADGNTQPPYDESGKLASDSWEEICRFDDVFELAAQAAEDRSAAESSAAAASESAAQANSAMISAARDAESAKNDRDQCTALAANASRSAENSANSAKAAQDALEEVQQIVGGDFAQKEDVDNIVSGATKVGKASFADSAQTAVQAEQDGKGNVIFDTYAAKTELADVVRFSAQSLSSANQQQARSNIGALSSEDTIKNALQINNESHLIIGKSVSSVQAGKTYIGCTLSGSVSASGKYYFINCSGTITVSGTTAQIFILDSAALTVNGITSNNWRNIFRDGIAEYVVSNTFVTITNTTQSGTTVANFKVLNEDYVFVSYTWSDLNALEYKYSVAHRVDGSEIGSFVLVGINSSLSKQTAVAVLQSNASTATITVSGTSFNGQDGRFTVNSILVRRYL